MGRYLNDHSTLRLRVWAGDNGGESPLSIACPCSYSTWLCCRFLQFVLLGVCFVSVVPSTNLAGIVDLTLLLGRDPNILWAEVVSRGGLDVERAVLTDHHAQAVALQTLPS